MTNLQTVPSKNPTAENARADMGNVLQNSLNNDPQTSSFSNFDDLLKKENSEKNTEEFLCQNKGNQKSKQIFLEQINACHLYNYDQINPKTISNFELDSADFLDSKFEINNPVNIIGELISFTLTPLAPGQTPSSVVSSSQPPSPTPAVPATDPSPTPLAPAQTPSLVVSSSQPSSPTPAVLVTDLSPTPLAPAQTPSSVVSSSQPPSPTPAVPATDPSPTPLAPAQTPSSVVSSSQASSSLSLEEVKTENFALNTFKEDNSPHPTKTQESLISSTDKNHTSPATKKSANQAQDFPANNQNSLLHTAQSEEKIDPEATQPIPSFSKPNHSENLTQSLKIPPASKIDNHLEFNNFIKYEEIPANNNQQTNQSHLGSQVGSLFKTLSTEVEKFQQTGHTNVQLDLKVSDNEDIKIRLTLRGGEIRSTFITESPELRDALQKGWPEFSQNSRDKGHRFSDPAFQEAFQDNNANSKEQRRSQNQQFTDTGTEDALRLNKIAPKRQMTTKSSNPIMPQPALWA